MPRRPSHELCTDPGRGSGPHHEHLRAEPGEDRRINPSSAQINALVVDATDPERLAAFWSDVLGRPVVGRTGPYVWPRRENGLGLGYQRTDAPKAGKNRMHVDIAAPGPVAEQRRIEAFGGRRAAGYEDGGFLVRADPEGNESCVIPTGPVDLGDEGRAHHPG